MPIYEYCCEQCDEIFEALAAISAADAPRECPQCGLASPRIISACAIGAGAAATRAEPAAQSRPHGRTRRPTIPEYARPCWMDDRSAERFAAYKMGRGAEYDDKTAVREERRKQRGLPPAEAEPQGHSHSPVAEILARKKAQDAAQAESNTAKTGSAPANHADPRPSN
jgi:putative FmdB family regulatory protein